MLRQRIVTALLMGGLLLFVLFGLSAGKTVWIFGAILLLGGWEWSTFIGLHRTAQRVLYVAVLGLCMAGLWINIVDSERLLGLMLFTTAWWLVALVWIVAAPTRTSPLLAGVAGVLSLVPAWIALSRLHGGLGPQWVLFLFLLIATADIGAYMAGRKLGRHKLAPRVSPGKTWEGVIGGVVLSLLIAWLGGIWFKQNVIPFIALCFVVVLGSIVGDLNESLFKRSVGLKDSSQLLPGHGGVLDRIDSMTAAAPLFLLGLIWLDVFK